MKLTVNGFIFQLSLWRFHSGGAPSLDLSSIDFQLKGTGRKAPSGSGLALGAQCMPRLSRDKHQIRLLPHLRGYKGFIRFPNLKVQICLSAFNVMLRNTSPKPRRAVNGLQIDSTDSLFLLCILSERTITVMELEENIRENERINYRWTKPPCWKDLSAAAEADSKCMDF